MLIFYFYGSIIYALKNVCEWYRNISKFIHKRGKSNNQ